MVAIALVVVAVILWRFRSRAAAERKAVLTRLAAEREEFGDQSPLADLFREVGVPHHEMFGLASDEPEDPAPVPTAGAMFSETESPEVPARVPLPDAIAEVETSAEQRPGALAADVIDAVVAAPRAAAPVPEVPVTNGADLRKLLAGIKMPCGLQPLGPLQPSSASFSSPALASVIQAGLAAEFERLNCDVTWSDLTVAHLERNGLRGLTTIYPDATQATHLDGRPLFSSVPSGHCVVRMIGL